MTSAEGEMDEAARQQAAVWFERMRSAKAAHYRVDFEHWRQSEQRNADAYVRFERNWELAGRLRSTEMGRARQLTPKRHWSFAFPMPRYAMAAAVLIFAIVAGSLFALNGASRAPQVASFSPPLATPVGQIRQKHLDDGSIITLDTDTLVEIALSKSSRVVRLIRGRARFEVAHDTMRPFIVEAAGRTVTARGTIFDVSLIGDGLKVSLLRGAIDVAAGAASRPTPGTIARLSLGQSLRVFSGKPTPVLQLTGQGEDRWVAGMLTFDGTPLSEVLAQINRYSGHKLRIMDPALKDLRVTGAFRALPIDECAAALAAALSLRVERAPNGDYILQPR